MLVVSRLTTHAQKSAHAPSPTTTATVYVDLIFPSIVHFFFFFSALRTRWWGSSECRHSLLLFCFFLPLRGDMDNTADASFASCLRSELCFKRIALCFRNRHCALLRCQLYADCSTSKGLYPSCTLLVQAMQWKLDGIQSSQKPPKNLPKTSILISSQLFNTLI
ncbi:hypothetical protein GGI43DRAFT_42273 [Trichoderma evansii]